MADDPNHHHHHHHHYYREAGAFGQPSPNPYRLRRSRRHRIVAGVCGGLSDYFGWTLWKVRLLTFLGFIFLPPITFIFYLGLMLILKSEEPGPRHAVRRGDDEFWRTVATRPQVTFSMMKHRFRAIDGRLADMERAVTSDEYRLNRAFRDLEQPGQGPAPAA